MFAPVFLHSVTMSCMTNSLEESSTSTLRSRQQHKVVSVSVLAPQSLTFDPKGCCSQRRMKERIVQFALTSLMPHKDEINLLKKADTG